MQYGNSSGSDHPMRHPQFKSYYVVWKQNEEAGVGVSPTPFKSYYVVWKLPILQEMQTPFVAFKSYYVVWKPCFDRSEV